MTNEELKQFSFKLIETMIAKQCYVKAYGKMFRVCDKDHNPHINLTRQQFEILKLNKVVEQSNLIWVLNVMANPFTNSIQIKLPAKQYSNENA